MLYQQLLEFQIKKTSTIYISGNYPQEFKQTLKNQPFNIDYKRQIPLMIPTKGTKTSYKSKNIFNYHSQPVFPVQIDQSLSIISLQISQYGRMGGVLFIQTPKGSFVLKANNQTAQNFFYNQFALMLDINVPLMTTIACYDAQFKKLVYLIQKYCHEDQVLYARLRPKLDFPFYQIIEYIPSILPVHIGKDKFMKHMTTDYKFYSIGMALAFDMIINNSDRFKLLWGNSGNLNNVLIQLSNPQKQTMQKAKNRQDDSVPLGNFAFVDNQGYMINPQNVNAKNNVQNYMQKVTQFQLNMIQYLRKQNSSLPQQFDKLTKQIFDQTNYKFTDENIVRICEGIIYSTKKFIILYEAQEIKNLYESIPKPTDSKKKEVNYWNEYWNNLFKKVSMIYCELFYIKISAIYTTYPQLINQIYQRVRKVVEANKNTRRRRVSKNSRKSSQISSNKNGEDIGGQTQQNGQQKTQNKLKEEEEQDNESKRKRKWRQKLQVFKKQNYRE